MTRTIAITTLSSEETVTIGQKLAGLLQPGHVVLLNGPLGAGKTCITRGIAAGLGLASADAVTSPTFTLIHEYPTKPPLIHFDVYRLKSEKEFLGLGVEEYLSGGNICIIEWAEKVMGCLPEDCINIQFEITSPESRKLYITAPEGFPLSLLPQPG